MSINAPIVVGIGEVLWDLLPSGKQLGGAPANFAYHAQALGATGVVVSAVGDDDLGHEIEQRLEKLQINTGFLQTNAKYPTGTVTVELEADGKPHYVIHENVAWDNLTWEEPLTELAGSADAICFGSLAQRSFISRSTIQAFVQHARPECLRIFDLNLRQQYYSAPIIETTLESSNVLKLNDEEWPVLAELLKLQSGVPAGLQELITRYKLRLIALTQGAQGSLLVTPEGVHEQPASPVKVVDSIGAGDSFTAALAIGLLRKKALPEIHAHASKLAAYVCTQGGATPSIPRELKLAAK
jgi:fructokinase